MVVHFVILNWQIFCNCIYFISYFHFLQCLAASVPIANTVMLTSLSVAWKEKELTLVQNQCQHSAWEHLRFRNRQRRWLITAQCVRPAEMDIALNGRPPVTAQRPERTERALLLSVIRAEEEKAGRKASWQHRAPSRPSQTLQSQTGGWNHQL